MPKVPIDYSKTIIYKIEHIDYDNLVYVGFTTNWDRRKYSHKSNCNNQNTKDYNYKLYKMIRENGGWEMFRMVEVQKFPCKDKREAEKMETETMKLLKSTMNVNRSFVTIEERQCDKKVYDKEYHKQNYERDKERIKTYYEGNKEIIKAKKKTYGENNKEIIKARNKINREKQKILKQNDKLQ